MVIVGKLVLLALFVLAVYLPLKGWRSWQGGWCYVALIPAIPLLGLVGYILEEMLLENTGQALAPELMMLVVLGSLIMSAVIGVLQGKSKAS